jgi:chromosome segregation ATPase
MAEQWLTYQQLGELLGMSPHAARQRAARLKWRKQPGNDGKALVLVPDGEIATLRPRAKPAQAPSQTPDQVPKQASDGKALADAVAAFREVEERLRAERDAALAAAAAVPELRQQLGRAEGEAIALREAMAREVRRLEEAEASRKAVEATRDKALAAGRDAAMRAMALEAERSRIKPQAERVPTLETELASLREAQAREVRQLAQAEEALKAAETQRDAAQAARDATQAELTGWTAGGPLARAWRGFWRGRR